MSLAVPGRVNVRSSVALGDVASTLTDKEWEKTQIKTFSKWINLYLAKRNMEITNIAQDLRDGIKLINLLEVISDTKLGKYNKTPKMKIHQIANLNIAHEFLKAFYKEVNIKVVPSPEQINEGDLKAVLGLVWVLILRFSIGDVDEGGLAAKEGLLLWCQRNTAGYEGVDPPGIENFHTSWKNGLGFGALINKFRPDLLDYNSLDKSNPKACMEKAFHIAEHSLGIPPLLDPEDIADVEKPDEKSLMTYLAQYWKVFSAGTKIYLATKRLNRAINRRLVNIGLRDEYLQVAAEFLERVEHEQTTLKQTHGTSFDALRNQYFELEEYKVTIRAQLASLKLRVEACYAGLASKLQNEKFPPYVPPAHLTLEALQDKWNELLQLEGPYETGLTQALTQLFKQTFVHFDKNSNGTLSRDELQACFSALSLELTPADADRLYGSESDLPFEKFVSFMMDKLVDSSSSEQIREACFIVSRDKPALPVGELRTNLGAREMEWLISSGLTEGSTQDVDVDAFTSVLFSPI